MCSSDLAARLARYHAEHPGVGHVGRAGHDVACVLFHQKHLVERERRPCFPGSAINFHNGTGGDLQLPTAGLNDRVHERYLNVVVAHGDPAGDRHKESSLPGSRHYCNRMRVPLIFWLLRVLRKLGISRSISSK